MQSQPTEVITRNTAQLSVGIALLKVGPGIVMHVGIAIDALIPVSTCASSFKVLLTRYRPSVLKL